MSCKVASSWQLSVAFVQILLRLSLSGYGQLDLYKSFKVKSIWLWPIGFVQIHSGHNQKSSAIKYMLWIQLLVIVWYHTIKYLTLAYQDKATEIDYFIALRGTVTILNYKIHPLVISTHKYQCTLDLSWGIGERRKKVYCFPPPPLPPFLTMGALNHPLLASETLYSGVKLKIGDICLYICVDYWSYCSGYTLNVW